MKRKLSLKLFGSAFIHLKYVPAIIMKIKNWPLFILNYLGLKNGEFECQFRNGLCIKIDENLGATTIAVVFIKKDYGTADNNSTIIDIGANIGVYSIFAASTNNTVVYAFEPMIKNFRLLDKNIKLNKLETKILPFNLAVGAKREKRTLYLGESPFHSFLPAEESPFNVLYGNSKEERKQESMEINCISLKDIFDDNKIERCDMLKIDCEGAEYEILYNLPAEYFNKIKKIRLEYHKHKVGERNNGESLADFLIKKGFKIEKFKKATQYQGDLWLAK